MARTANPYYTADAAGLAPVGQGLTNLASVFAPPSAMSGMQADQMGWQTKAMQDELLNSARKREGQAALGDIIAGYEYGASDPRHLLSTGVRYGSEADELGTLFRVMAGNLPRATDETRMGALVGAGQMPGTGTAVSIGRQNELLDREAGAEEMRLRMKLDADRAKERDLMSRDQLLANIFLEGGPEAANEARPALYGPPSGSAPPDPWMAAKRRDDVEKTVTIALENAALDMGMGVEDVPPDLRALILTEAMPAIEQGASPRAIVADLLQRYNVRKDDTVWFNPFTRDSIQYDRPRAAPEQPPAAPTPPPAAPAAGVPPADQRVPGQVYNTPRGRMMWATDPATGDAGWVPAEG